MAKMMEGTTNVTLKCFKGEQNKLIKIKISKGIHSYTLNDRLFPVPIYKGKNGQSMCPVCKSTKKEGTSYSPQFCKISIPKSRIIEPYKIEPTKRSQTNSEDTLSLAEVFSFRMKAKT